MIERARGNPLESQAQALVHPVNLVGVMDDDDARRFQQAFPHNSRVYQAACLAGEMALGKVLVVDEATHDGGPRLVVNFPTRRHPDDKPRLADLELGLHDLVGEIVARRVGSVAISPLVGAEDGLGWSDVAARIECALALLPEVQVSLYEPDGLTSGAEVIDAARAAMTSGGAAVLCLMSRYLDPGHLYRLSMMEIQKLTYFLQEAGEDLRLQFNKHVYGPYANNLRKVLERMDGHFIRGYGEGAKAGSREATFTPVPDSARRAEALLRTDLATQTRYDRVANLIEGYESPQGMELLSTVHWVVTQELHKQSLDVDEVVVAVGDWSARKGRLLKPTDIAKAWQTLRDQKWL